jgi:cytochrome P450 family 6
MRWVEYVRSQCMKVDGIEAKDLGARFSLSMVLNNIFNSGEDCFDNEKEPEILKITETFAAASKPNFLWSLMSTLYPFLHKFSKISFAASHEINSYILMMQQAVESREKSEINRGDYLDHLIKLKRRKNLTIDNLSSYAVAFDGFDTTSSVISNALYELARNREVQEKLRIELKNSMPSEEDFTYENIVSHEYLDQVWHGECW